jgi:hypothetical protein
MKILTHSLHPWDALEQGLRNVTMSKDPLRKPYANCEIALATAVEPTSLAIAQYYVRRKELTAIEGVYRSFLDVGLDVFALHGFVRFTTDEEPEVERDLMPPIVEWSEPDGVWLICDGAHRTCTARKLGLPLNVVKIKGVPADLPYYAVPNERGWDQVDEVDAAPEGGAKKAYRIEEYRTLFRDFNTAFSNVTFARKGTGRA